MLYFLISAAIVSAWALLSLTGSERERMQREQAIKQRIAEAAAARQSQEQPAAQKAASPVRQKGKH
jgi:hypothetical protein